MKTIKSLLSLAIVSIIAISSFAFAADGDVTMKLKTELSEDKKQATTTITAPAGASLGAFLAKFEYDAAVFELVSASPDDNGAIATIQGGKILAETDELDLQTPFDYLIKISYESSPGVIKYGFAESSSVVLEDATEVFVFVLKKKDDGAITTAPSITGSLEGSALGGGGGAINIDIVPDSLRVAGDANNSGGVSITDATHIAKYLANKAAYTDGTDGADKKQINLSNADCNGKEGVSITDATYIAKWLALGKPSDFLK